MPKKLEKGFKKGYKPEKGEEEKIDEAEELAEEKIEENKEEEKIEEEKAAEKEEEKKIEPEAEKPEEKRIEIKPAVIFNRPEKGNWIMFEAPDKNGKKIVRYFGKAETMKAKLLGQEEVITFIPREPGEHKSVPQIVNLNGYKLNIPKNTYVSLPAQVAEVIRNAHQQVEDAYEEMNRLYGIDRDNRAVEALL